MTVRILVATSLAVLALPVAATAQSRPDPMRAAADHGASFSAGDPMLALSAPDADAADRPEGNPDLGGLPDAPGAEDTYYQCTACHSTEIIKQQSLSDARWDYLWDWMIEEQGMLDADPETKELIMGYLKSHFSSER